MSVMLKDIASMMIMRVIIINAVLIGVMIGMPQLISGVIAPTTVQVTQLIGAALISVLLHCMLPVPNHGGKDQ